MLTKESNVIASLMQSLAFTVSNEMLGDLDLCGRCGDMSYCRRERHHSLRSVERDGIILLLFLGSSLLFSFL